MNQNEEALQLIQQYHNRTKHSFARYAAGPAALDWDDQPEAFRWFTGCNQLRLPLVADTVDTLYADLYTPGQITPQPLKQRTIAALFELALGLSAWKQAGTAKWALRCNPSSGNLHPTEGYLINNSVDGIAAGVHHYLSRDHLLEQRCAFNNNSDELVPSGSLLVGLSSIHWREAWKYGERAYRYCQLDVGHAIAALRYAAATLGWQVQLLDEWSDGDIATLLGLDRDHDFGKAEREHADALLLITTQPTTAALNRLLKKALSPFSPREKARMRGYIQAVTTHLSPHPNPLPEGEGVFQQPVKPQPLLQAAADGEWRGQANRLSGKHFEEWPVIDEATELCSKPNTTTTASTQMLPAPLPSRCELTAATLIRQRRSAQEFDGVTAITAQTFYRILDMTLPRSDTVPWNTLPWPPQINLVLFVHRVEGLAPGLYALLRDQANADQFKAALQRQEFEWSTVEQCPAHLPLYRLVRANGQRLAATLSCHQSIAAQSCFSLGMIAHCEELESAPWRYRHLFWEAGMIGQVLYLEAEAAGIRGTGIGCYFDDAVHELLGIKDEHYQSLYHFTAGAPVVDHRLTTLSPYLGRE